MRTLAECTANDVAPEARDAYQLHVEHWKAELQPTGALETYFAAQIIRAAWRLGQYNIFDQPGLSDEARNSNLRYREQTNLGLRRNLDELRRLKPDKLVRRRREKFLRMGQFIE